MRILELFSGAGGFTALIDRSVYKMISAVDLDRNALKVYLINNPGTDIFKEDITTIRDFKGVTRKAPDIIVAGPPCQGFSPVGMKTKRRLRELKGYDPETDPRNFLPLEVSRAARQLRPEIVLMENVPAMRNHVIEVGGNRETVSEMFRAEMESIGYQVIGPVVVDSSWIGVAERRSRLFLLASRRGDLNRNSVDRLIRENKASRSVGDVINDLLRIPVSVSSEIPVVFPDHMGRLPNSDDLRIIRALRQGETYSSVVKRDPSVIAGRSHKVYGTSSFADKFYRLKWDEPSKTITAHLSKDGNSFIHPLLDRSISVREAARVHGFPDSFTFGIPKTIAYRLIGNSVSPPVGAMLINYAAGVCEDPYVSAVPLPG
ncbi:MAG: DNA cytosine methyltransferase [Candidatus Thermoplasmatota archaeon]|nr:DNA cytosine methyltransferase [Candidatus Thermoplasmatota archaeon]